MNLKPVITIYFDQRRLKKEGLVPVKLRVFYNGEVRLFSLKENIRIVDIENFKSSKPKSAFKDSYYKVHEYMKRANDLILKLNPFAFDDFESALFNKKLTKEHSNCVFKTFRKVIMELEDNGKIRTAYLYNNSLTSIKSFTGKEELLFSQVDSNFLKKYNDWMIRNGRSTTTLSMYLRCLRRLFNEAIDKGFLSRDSYPFGKYKFQILASRNIKKALTKSEVGRLVKAEVEEGSLKQRSRDIWFFSYLCNGANFKDIAKLRVMDIHNNRINFIRSKTSTTAQFQNAIVSIMTPEMIEIIQRWGNINGKENDYIFPFLKKTYTPRQELIKIRDEIKLINKHIGKLAVETGITAKVTTMTARHSFATVLRREGASNEFIGEAMGHSNLKTTENYLDSFEDDVKTTWAEKLVNF
ncbi:MAG: tyrosine-type recombinase/integrase [Bacteroidota bacterium]